MPWAVPALWVLFDGDSQAGWDKVVSTYVAHSPNGFRPLTAKDMSTQGEQPPAMGGVPRQRAEPSPPSGLMDYPQAATSAAREPGADDRLLDLQRRHTRAYHSVITD